MWKVLTTWKVLSTFFFGLVIFFGLTLRHAGSWLLNKGLNLSPLQWMCGVLTTGPPGKSKHVKMTGEREIINSFNIYLLRIYYVTRFWEFTSEQTRLCASIREKQNTWCPFNLNFKVLKCHAKTVVLEGLGQSLFYVMSFIHRT